MTFGFDPLYQKYPSRRYPIYAGNGMVNCSSPLAASAGLTVLQKGGNAMDAAVAAAAALTVVEPTANGIGSDAFALIWSEKNRKLYGLNSSGRAPMLASISKIINEGRDDNGKMPRRGWTPVTVPGAPMAWAEINKQFGMLSLTEVIDPAVRYAQEGYPCAPNLAQTWRNCFEAYKEEFSGECFNAWFRTFAPLGRPYNAGEIVKLPDHAQTLRLIAETGAEDFYKGELAKKIDAQSRKYGGYLRYEDLAVHKAVWVNTISVNYRGYDVCEIPPNGQGITALMALNILKEFSFPQRDCPETCHRQIEAMKMAFADSFHYVTDPARMVIDYHTLLRPEYGAARALEMTDRAQIWTYRNPVQLYGIRIRDRGRRNWDRAPEPRHGFLFKPSGCQLSDAGKENLSHDHPRLSDEGWPSHRPIRRHGRIYAAPGPRTGRDEYDRLPHGSPAGAGCPALAMASGRKRHCGTRL